MGTFTGEQPSPAPDQIGTRVAIHLAYGAKIKVTGASK